MTPQPSLQGLLRLKQIIKPLGPIPMSASSWWAGVRDGRLPLPVKLGPRTTCWRAEDIAALVAKGIDNADA